MFLENRYVKIYFDRFDRISFLENVKPLTDIFSERLFLVIT